MKQKTPGAAVALARVGGRPGAPAAPNRRGIGPTMGSKEAFAMTFLRILLLVAAAWLVWRIFRQVRAQLQAPTAPQNDVRDDHFEPMARCAQCGTHMPAKVLNSKGTCGRCSE
ncbi:MAG TPA: PP0621 family protein [Fontimonas sp.]